MGISIQFGLQYHLAMSGDWKETIKNTISQLKDCHDSDELEVVVLPNLPPKPKLKDSFSIFFDRLHTRNQNSTIDLVKGGQQMKEKKEIDLTMTKEWKIQPHKERDAKKIVPSKREVIDVEQVNSKQNVQKYKNAIFQSHQRPMKFSAQNPPINRQQRPMKSSMQPLPLNRERQMKKQMQVIQEMNKPAWVIQKQQRKAINKEKYPISYNHSYNYDRQFSGLRTQNDQVHEEYLKKRQEVVKQNKEKKRIQRENKKKEKQLEERRILEEKTEEAAKYISEMMDHGPSKKIKENTEIEMDETLTKNDIVEEVIAAEAEIPESAQFLPNRTQQRYGLKDIIKNNQLHISYFIKSILKYKYGRSEDQPTQKRIPQNFQSDASMYRRTFHYLITTECIADIKHRLKSINSGNGPIKVSITDHRTNTDNYVQLRLKNVDKDLQSSFKNISLSKFRLGVICSSPEYKPEYYGVRHSSKHQFAFICLLITPQTKDDLFLDVKVKAIINETDLELRLKKNIKKQVYFFDLEKITTQLREYLAVSNIAYSELAPAILDPKLVEREQTVFVQYREKLENIMKYLGEIFNQTQWQSIREMALRERGFVLLQGPPGTGKTSTLMGLLSAQYEYLKQVKDTRKIMICAPSNAAVDHIVKRIINQGLFNGDGQIIKPNILRVGVVETDDPDVRSVSLDDLCEKQFREMQQQQKQRSKMTSPQIKQKLIQIQKEMRAVKANSEQWQKIKKQLTKYQNMMYSFRSDKFVVRRKTFATIENHLLNRAEIILTTLASSGADKMDLLRGEFACLIVDEAAQATEPNLLIALQTGVQKVLLIGDPCQLPATCISQDSNVTLFNRSLFERLLDAGIKPYFLNIQYRMAPKIRAFPSACFYQNRLLDAQSISTRQIPQYLSNFNNRCVLFIDVKYGIQEKRGDSYCNWQEAKVVSLLIRCLLNPNISLGLITPYQGQRKAILKYSLDCLESSEEERALLEKEVMINTVDSFQGQEKDVIVVSTVRANHGNQVGFLTDERRINVTLTRAKHLIIVVGNGDTLGSNQIWNKFLEWAERDDCYYSIYREDQVQDVVGLAFQDFSQQKVRRRRHEYFSTDIRKIKRSQIQSQDFQSAAKKCESAVPSWIQKVGQRTTFDPPNNEPEIQEENLKHALNTDQVEKILVQKKKKQDEDLQMQQMFLNMKKREEELKKDKDYSGMFQ